MKIDKLVAKQRKFFAEGKTLSISFRKKALDSLKAAIKKYESEINDAVFAMVGCSPWGPEESETNKQLHFHFSLSCTGEGNGNVLQCSCLENPRDSGAW